jgi:class 3 adenylate cyclase
MLDGKVGGIAAEIGLQVANLAGDGEVLVSSTVKDLVAGSGIGFVDNGSHQLSRIAGEWRLFVVEQGKKTTTGKPTFS